MTLLLFGCDPAGIGSTDYGYGEIRGYAMDMSTNNGVSDVLIITSPASDSVATDAAGNFFILNIQLNTNPQDVQIIAIKEGYQTAQVKTTLKSDQTTQVTIPMYHKQ